MRNNNNKNMETRVRESKEQKVLSENKIEADVFYP